MISTSRVVESLIKQTPFLESALANGIINHSSLARILRPKIEEKLMKPVKDGAIVMALKRLSNNLKKTLPPSENILKILDDTTIRSSLTDYTFLESPTLADAQNKLAEKTTGRKDIFITISHGVSQITVIASGAIEDDIKEIFKNETLICKLQNLSSITVRIPTEATKIPGVLYSVLKILAWNGINLIECVSTFTELTVVIETKDIERAFSSLQSNSK